MKKLLIFLLILIIGGGLAYLTFANIEPAKVEVKKDVTK
jgi:hypothetical protein